ncbi:MAG: Tol-Pal system beta propeller repeat protein TolB, partial [Deltaproteobacteria bacterium]|nr:Tol-Pal system beta propeller repeat protein TolB [Deltaproteobacteria bacterium]
MSVLHVLLAVIISASTAQAKVYIDIDSPGGKKLPIALQGFKTLANDRSDAVNDETYNALSGDLDFSGLFDIISKKAHIVNPESGGIALNEIDFSSWRAIGAQMLVTTGVKIEDQTLTVEFRLFDTVRENLIVGRRYIGSTKDPRIISHRFADEIIRELTGSPGIFSTKLLFASIRTGSKEIYVSDYDGGNVRQVTKNNSINLSPQWSP